MSLLRQHVAGAQAANAFGIGINGNTAASISMTASRFSSNPCGSEDSAHRCSDIQYAAHSFIRCRRFANASDRRYAASVSSAMTRANACSHTARKVRHVPRPIAERRAKAVRRGLHVSMTRNGLGECHVADGFAAVDIGWLLEGGRAVKPSPPKRKPPRSK